jgi:hypothetical protein
MIRPPDEYRTERLNNSSHSSHSNIYNSLKDISYTEQIKIAIEVSKQDYCDEMEQIEEQQIIELYQEQFKQRENQVNSILTKLKRLGKFDKEINDILSFLTNIFEQYTKGFIEYHILDDKERYMKNLLKIRFTDDEREFLKQFLR